jgi:pimeloyl-ACP methyl ester carboxylesterase
MQKIALLAIAAALSLVSLAPGQTAEYKYATVDGLKLFYREAGPRSARTIVLLHGFPSSSHMFRELIPRLAQTYHVVAPDYVGFGYSDAPSPKTFAYTFDHLAKVTDDLLTQIGVSRYTLYLQDYGGPVGMRIATAHPVRVDGLVIQNSNAYLEGISPFAYDVLAKFGSNRNPDTEKAVSGLFTLDGIKFGYVKGSPNPDRISPDAYNFDFALFQAKPENREIQLDLFADYQNNVALYDSWHAYFRKYQPKTLVVWGKGDPFFTTQGAEALRRDLKNVDFNLLDAGHFALEEKLNVIAEKLNRFLGNLK